jgi:23S rRNA (pseudouridine1915-N3)-methyltransferase
MLNAITVKTRIQIISPGKVREPWLQSAIKAKMTALNRLVTVSLTEVADVADSWPADKARREEARQILTRIGPRDFVVALDLQGRYPRPDPKRSGTVQNQPGIDLGYELADWLEQGRGELLFMIGGSNGLDESVLQRANRRLCLSAMTWTHQMTRLVLLTLLESAILASRRSS